MFDLVFWFVVVATGPVADAVTIAGCTGAGDAPVTYDSSACAVGARTMCKEDANGDVECSLAGCTDGNNEAWAVHDYQQTGQHEFSAWGKYHGTTWCCVIDDTATPTIDKFILVGCAYAANDPCEPSDGERMGFQWPPSQDVASADNMAPHRAQALKGYIYGDDGSGEDMCEEIWGSDYQGNDYHDQLYGLEGNDLIDGGADGDWIDGGPGNDTCRGSGGPDHIVGGDDIDSLLGGDGNDVMCDVEISGTAQHMDGGNDADVLFMTYLNGTGCWDATSTGGASTSDAWGDSTNLPGACQPIGTENAYGSSEPTQCTDPG